MTSRFTAKGLRLLALCATLAVVNFSATSSSSSAATATPVPGGANQANALSGSVGTWLFNGHYRLKMLSIGDATPEQLTASDMTSANGNGKRVIVMSYQMRLGAKDGDDVVAITLSDADGNSVSLPSSYITPNPTPSVTQGAGWKNTAYAVVADDFKVAKIVITFPTDLHHGGFRIAVK